MWSAKSARNDVAENSLSQVEAGVTVVISILTRLFEATELLAVPLFSTHSLTFDSTIVG